MSDYWHTVNLSPEERRRTAFALVWAAMRDKSSDDYIATLYAIIPEPEKPWSEIIDEGRAKWLAVICELEHYWWEDAPES